MAWSAKLELSLEEDARGVEDEDDDVGAEKKWCRDGEDDDDGTTTKPSVTVPSAAAIARKRIETNFMMTMMTMISLGRCGAIGAIRKMRFYFRFFERIIFESVPGRRQDGRRISLSWWRKKSCDTLFDVFFHTKKSSTTPRWPRACIT